MAKIITSEIALCALLERLVNPTLAKLKPFGAVRAAEHDIANQMEAVAWLYNQYVCQELPNLVALGWEEFCAKASVKQTRLSKFLGAGRPAVSCPLTLTEHKIKNGCEAAEALKATTNSRQDLSVTKVCVCLLNFRQDKCVLAFGARTTGLWSFIERDTRTCCSENGSGDGLHVTFSDEAYAFKAVREQTGINGDVLHIEDHFLINGDLNRAGGSTRFFIMSCTGTFDLAPTVKLEKIAWVSLDYIFSMSRDDLIDTSGSIVQCSPAVQYICVRPFCPSVENWLSRQREVKSLAQAQGETGNDDKAQNRTELVICRSQGGKTEEKSVSCRSQGGKTEEKFGFVKEEPAVEKQRPSKLKFDAMDGSVPLFESSGSPQLLISQKHAFGKDINNCNNGRHLVMMRLGGDGGEKPLLVQDQEEDSRQQAKVEVNALLSNTASLAQLKNRTDTSELRDKESVDYVSVSVEEQDKERGREIDPTNTVEASDKAVLAPNCSPQSSTKIRKREEEHMIDKAGALLSLKSAYQSVSKKRKLLCKELRELTVQTDLLYKQIEECDTELATLIGGGKVGLQLAIQLCKNNGQKQTASSNVSINQSQADLLVKSRATTTAHQPEASSRKRPFQMLKSSMQELNEVCTRNEWPLPSYGVFSVKNNQRQALYSGKVRVRGTDFELSETGEASENAKAAKLSAAAYMLSTLHRLRARNAML